MRGCWTTVRHSADVSADGFSRISSGTRDLADVVEKRRDAQPVDVGVGQLQLARQRHDDRGDQRRRLAAVVGERVEHRRQGGRRRIPGAQPDLDRPCPAGGRDRRPRDAGVVVGLGEDVCLVAPERLGRVHRRVGVADERVHPQLRLPEPPAMPIEMVTAMSPCALDGEALALDERPQLLGEGRPFLDVRLGQDQHELLAAVAADQVRGAQVGRDRLGHAAQDDVADGVPVRVVDGLEVVDVDERDRQRPAVARRPLDLGEQRSQQRLPVGDAGQPVERSRGRGISTRAAAMLVDRRASRRSRPVPRGLTYACSRPRRCARRP